MDTPTFEIDNISPIEVTIESGSGGPTTWSNVSQKPFETIGEGLEVVSGALNVTAVGGNVDDVKVNGVSVVDEDKIAQVTVPTKTSDITNDSGYITNSYHDNTKQDVISDLSSIRSGAALGTTSIQPDDNVSELTNDAGYITNSYHDSSKQDVISDLGTIRSNATAGASAASTISGYGDVVTHDADEFATASQGAKADTAVQPGDNVSDLTNDAGYLTEHQSLANYSTTTQMNTAIANHHDSTKQDSLPAVTNDRYLHTNSSTGALEWATVQSGGGDVADVKVDGTSVVDANKVAQIDLTGKQDKLPTTVNDRFLHTNETTGALEWKEGNIGGDDVVIQGDQVIISDGTITVIDGDPTDPATEVMTKIRIGDLIFQVEDIRIEGYMDVTSLAGATVTIDDIETYTYGPSETVHRFGPYIIGRYIVTATKSGYSQATTNVTMFSGVTDVDCIPQVLPSGYTELEYIQSSGTQFLNTGTIMKPQYTLTIEYGRVEGVTYSSSDWSYVMGERTTPTTFVGEKGSDNNWHQYYLTLLTGGYYPGQYYEGYGDGYGSATKDKVVLAPDRIVLNDNVLKTYDPLSPSMPYASEGMFLFARSFAGIAYDKSTYKIFSFKVTEDNEDVINLIPCKRDSDNEIGMYDTVAQAFLTNQGTGTFVPGDPV